MIKHIAITTKANEMLNDYCKTNGMVQYKIASRVLQWYVKQPQDVQAIIQGYIKGKLTAELQLPIEK